MESQNKKNIALIGAGSWGTAIAKTLGNNHNVFILKKEKNSLTNIDLLPTADYVFVVIPTQANRSLFLDIKNSINEKQMLILCSKGIEKTTDLLVHQICEKIFPHNKIAILSGPNFAVEIFSGLPAISTIACKELEVAQKIANDLSTENFKLYPSDDILSAEIFGAIKNVIAIACGISSGLHLGENFKAAIITRMIIEIQELIKNLGGNINSIISPAGIGDIILTCTSNKSRNTNYGLALTKKKDAEYLRSNTVEGYYTLNSIYHIALKAKLNLPIIFYLYQIIYGDTKLSKSNFINVINSSL